MDNNYTLQSLYLKGLIWPAEGKGGPTLSPPSLIPFGATEIDNHLFGGGLPCGAIHEWLCDEAPLQILIALASSALKKSSQSSPEGQRRVFWIGENIWPTPHCFDDKLLACSIFLKPPTSKLKLWSMELALRSPATAALVCACRNLHFFTTQRFLHAAKHGNGLGLIIRPEKELSCPSAATTRWHVSPLPSPSTFPRWRLKLLHAKSSKSLLEEWIIEVDEERSLKVIQEKVEFKSLRVAGM